MVRYSILLELLCCVSIPALRNRINPQFHTGGCAAKEPRTMDNPNTLMTDEHIDQASRAMKAMSHPLRLKILCVLGEGEVSVQEIVDQVGTTQSNISQHLALMREKGVLRTRKDANRVFYRVGDIRTLEVIAMLRDVFCGFSG